MIEDPILRRLIGNSISNDAAESAMLALVSHRASTFHLDKATGHGGWYRRLGEPGRLGYVATAQMMIFAASQPDDELQLQRCVRFLVDTQRDDGGWPFVTNTIGLSVVDSAAWVIMALSAVVDRSSLGDLRDEIRSAIQRGTDFVRVTELPAGGWGIMPRTEWRALSTALALRALRSAGAGPADASVVSAARSLVSHIDPNSSAWCDSNRHLSIAVTSTATLALEELHAATGTFGVPLARARRWLISARENDSWGNSSQYTSHEEVEFFDDGGSRARIEYHYSRRPQAIAALSSAGVGPEVCDGLERMLSATKRDDPQEWCGCDQRSWTSWVVFDCWSALYQAQRSLPSRWEKIWWTPSRVVVSERGERLPITLLRRYWPHIGVVLLSIAILAGVTYGGLVEGIGPQAVTFVFTTIALSVIANLASALVLELRRRPNV